MEKLILVANKYSLTHEGIVKNIRTNKVLTGTWNEKKKDREFKLITTEGGRKVFTLKDLLTQTFSIQYEQWKKWKEYGHHNDCAHDAVWEGKECSCCPEPFKYKGRLLVPYVKDNGEFSVAFEDQDFESVDAATAHVDYEITLQETKDKIAAGDFRPEPQGIAPPEPTTGRKLKLNRTQVCTIREQLASGNTMKAIAEFHHIHPSLVADVKYGSVKAYAAMV